MTEEELRELVRSVLREELPKMLEKELTMRDCSPD